MFRGVELIRFVESLGGRIEGEGGGSFLSF